MYLLETISRLQADGRDDTVSLYLPGIDEERLSAETREQMACFLRMAATFAKLAASQARPDALEQGCLFLNRAMDECTRNLENL
jgi:hypothetical protein